MMVDTDPEPLTIETGKYRHTKSGKLYEVLGVALETETAEQLVVYRPLYNHKYQLFARPYAIFCEDIEFDGQVVPRFEKVDN